MKSDRFKVLITVKTYPLPSRSYDELVCTAGVLEDGTWIRIYPVPFKCIVKNNILKKYQWVEIDLKPRGKKDFRPESYSPVKPDLSDVKVLNFLEAKKYWTERKKYCLKNVFYSREELLKQSNAPQNLSLATFKPKRILDFVIENDTRDWKDVWIERRKQLDLFSTDEENKKAVDTMIRKLPYKFSYHFEDVDGKKSKMMIEDWEIGALYWNCLADSEGDEKVALEKVRYQYFERFTKDKEIYLFLGTTLQFHQRRMKNPFVIIGVFYPQKDPTANQLNMSI